ncbi:hypothetical protein NMY22_g3284 [Coprinellus aureogranulatus]|nr:hypothetical protein NMY22_g3284 [Coprinellus aureogranulatus]
MAPLYNINDPDPHCHRCHGAVAVEGPAGPNAKHAGKYYIRCRCGSFYPFPHSAGHPPGRAHAHTHAPQAAPGAGTSSVQTAAKSKNGKCSVEGCGKEAAACGKCKYHCIACQGVTGTVACPKALPGHTELALSIKQRQKLPDDRRRFELAYRRRQPAPQPPPPLPPPPPRPLPTYGARLPTTISAHTLATAIASRQERPPLRPPSLASVNQQRITIRPRIPVTTPAHRDGPDARVPAGSPHPFQQIGMAFSNALPAHPDVNNDSDQERAEEEEYRQGKEKQRVLMEEVNQILDWSQDNDRSPSPSSYLFGPPSSATGLGHETGEIPEVGGYDDFGPDGYHWGGGQGSDGLGQVGEEYQGSDDEDAQMQAALEASRREAELHEHRIRQNATTYSYTSGTSSSSSSRSQVVVGSSGSSSSASLYPPPSAASGSFATTVTSSATSAPSSSTALSSIRYTGKYATNPPSITQQLPPLWFASHSEVRAEQDRARQPSSRRLRELGRVINLIWWHATGKPCVEFQETTIPDWPYYRVLESELSKAQLVDIDPNHFQYYHTADYTWKTVAINHPFPVTQNCYLLLRRSNVKCEDFEGIRQRATVSIVHLRHNPKGERKALNDKYKKKKIHDRSSSSPEETSSRKKGKKKARLTVPSTPPPSPSDPHLYRSPSVEFRTPTTHAPTEDEEATPRIVRTNARVEIANPPPPMFQRHRSHTFIEISSSPTPPPVSSSSSSASGHSYPNSPGDSSSSSSSDEDAAFSRSPRHHHPLLPPNPPRIGRHGVGQSKWPKGLYCDEMAAGIELMNALKKDQNNRMNLAERFKYVFGEVFASKGNSTWHDQVKRWQNATEAEREAAMEAGHSGLPCDASVLGTWVNWQKHHPVSE